MTKEKIKNYISPEVEMVEFSVEQGFAYSDPLPGKAGGTPNFNYYDDEL